jgi:predicted N-acetyltransferase YhbS
MPDRTVIKQIPFGSVQYEAMKRLREEVLRLPIGLGLSEIDLQGEENQFHFAAVLEGGSIAGTALLKPLSPTLVKLRQMAIAPSLQGAGLGRRMVRFIEGYARKAGYEAIELNARVYAQPFYERLGFAAQGSHFIEVTLPTIKMVKRLVPD